MVLAAWAALPGTCLYYSHKKLHNSTPLPQQTCIALTWFWWLTSRLCCVTSSFSSSEYPHVAQPWSRVSPDYITMMHSACNRIFLCFCIKFAGEHSWIHAPTHTIVINDGNSPLLSLPLAKWIVITCSTEVLYIILQSLLAYVIWHYIPNR